MCNKGLLLLIITILLLCVCLSEYFLHLLILTYKLSLSLISLPSSQHIVKSISEAPLISKWAVLSAACKERAQSWLPMLHRTTLPPPELEHLTAMR